MVTPPSSINPPVSSGTPVHTRSSTTRCLDSKYLPRDQIFGVMSEEMAPFFLGPMPPQEFLSTFLPSLKPSSFQAGMFDALSNLRNERLMYKIFITIVQSHLKTLYIHETSHSADKAVTEYSASFSPDCTVYDQANKDVTETNSAKSDIYIEFKSKPEEDAFLTNIPSKEPSVSNLNPLMRQTARGTLTAGQITTYAALQLDSQYRTHVFSILIVKDYARLIRWDRSGAIVTGPIYYQRDAALLDFFTRYDQADRPARGHDDSVRRASSAEIEQAVKADKRFLVSQELLVVTVPLQGTESKCGEYIIKPPVARPYTPPGRATRTSIAYDTQRNRLVFFKDSWRVACNGIMKEGDVYAILNAARVRNIPRCSAAGDVGEEAYHSTRTSKYADADWVWQNATLGFTPHRHHRLILDDIGEKLETFRCSRDMVRAVCAALNAHKDAYWVCRILHRDISPSNILRTERTDFEGGLLIDWDLCKTVDPSDPLAGGARQPTRTGTWQFMAADLVKNPNINQTFIHDIESAFFVLLWMSIFYVKSTWELDIRSSFVSEMFHPQVFGSSGGSTKTLFMRDDQGLDDLNFHDNIPLGELLRELKELLAVRHGKRPEKAPLGRRLKAKNKIHQTHRQNTQGTPSGSTPATGSTKKSLREEEDLQQRIEDHDACMAALENHDVFISAIAGAITIDSEDECTLWPGIEPAEKQPFVLSDTDKRHLRSSSKRCREAAAECESGDVTAGQGESCKRAKFCSLR